MVVLSGGQPMPNLLGLLAYQNPKPDFFHVLHSEDRNRSAEPARRLVNFVIKNGLAGKAETISLESSYPDIHAVSGAVQKLMDAYPEAEWTLNATGGLKPMSVAFADYATSIGEEEEPNVRVIYREESGSVSHWKQWFRDGDSWLRSKISELHEEEDLLHRFKLEDFAELNRGSTPGLGWQTEEPCAGLGEDLLLKWIEAGPDKNWDWRKIVQEHGPAELRSMNLSGGFLFEHFIAGIIRCLGVRRLSMSLGLGSGKQGSRSNKSETDIVAVHENSLYLFELKLVTSMEEKIPGGTSLVARASQMAHLARSLGGLTGKGILILPGYRKNKSQDMDEVATILGMRHMWRQEDMVNLIPNLLALFGIEENEASRKLDAAIRCAALRGDLFSITGTPPPGSMSMKNSVRTLGQHGESVLAAVTDRLFTAIALTPTLLHVTIRSSALCRFDPNVVSGALDRAGVRCEESDLSKAALNFKNGKRFLHLRVAADSMEQISSWLKTSGKRGLPNGFSVDRELPGEPEAVGSFEPVRETDDFLTEIALLREQIAKMAGNKNKTNNH